MSSSNYVDWPTCAECSDRRKLTHPFEDPWCPVEEYGVEVDDTPNILLASYTIRIVVTARCSHGRGDRDSFERLARKQTSEPIDCPIFWNVDRMEPLKSHYLRAAIRSLTFFRGEAKPSHRMVTLVH